MIAIAGPGSRALKSAAVTMALPQIDRVDFVKHSGLNRFMNRSKLGNDKSMFSWEGGGLAATLSMLVCCRLQVATHVLQGIINFRHKVELTKESGYLLLLVEDCEHWHTLQSTRGYY